MNCRPCNRGPGMRQQRGAALIVALLVFALCTALIVAMKGELTRVYQRGANLFLAEQAYAYLRGAEDLAALALLLDYDRDHAQGRQRDDLSEIWAQPTTPYALDGGGWLRGSLEDLQGRFNLNSLVGRAPSGSNEPDRPRFSPAQAQFIRLLQALEEPPVSQQEAVVITASIGDWLDGNTVPAPGGAEDDYYVAMTPAYRSANAPMASVSELRAVAHITPQIYRALRPWVTVWPRAPGALNIHTAPLVVLRSINADDDLSPLSESEGEMLLAQRADTGFADVDDFLASPVFTERLQGMGGMRALLGEHSSCFLLDATVEVAERKLHLYSVLERHQRSIRALVRSTGSL